MALRPGSGACIYWIHTHDASGVIHVESKPRAYRLGEFFAVWGEPLARTAVGPYRGRVSAFVNGKAFKANPREIPIGSYQQIVLEVGSRVINSVPFILPLRIAYQNALFNTTSKENSCQPSPSEINSSQAFG